MAKKKIRMTTAERIEIFRPNLMLSRLDNQENNFVQSAMFWVRQQTENLAIQIMQGAKPDKLTLNPLAVRNMADALAASMIDTYALGEISYQNEYVQAEQIHQAKLNGTYQKNIVPFASASASASPFTPEVGLDWYKDYTLRLIGVHSVDALENTKNTVIKGIDEGLNQEQTISLIRNQFPTFSQHRLENIARTETAKIYEQARYQQMVDDEEVVGYEFFAIMDSRTSDICRSRDGKKILKGQEQGWLPPLHFGCRSVLAPVFAWEDVRWDMAGTAVDALPGFGSTQMTIPESARNKIYIAGIPELRSVI